MPWDCQQCQTTVPDDQQTCPDCQTSKAAWTMNVGQTRTMTISAGSKVECLRGQTTEPWEIGDWLYAGAQWQPTEVMPALPLARARALRAQGKFPAPHDVLCIRVQPAKAKDWGVKLTILFDTKDVGEVDLGAYGATVDRTGQVDLKLLGVFAPEGEQVDVVFPGLHVVDLSDAGPTGAAPQVEVTALKKPPIPLGVETGEPGPAEELVVLAVVQGADGQPVAEAEFEVVRLD